MMGLLEQLVDLLRDSVWNGIVGVITIVTVLVALVRLAINLIRGLRAQQGFTSAVNKTIAEIAGWTSRAVDYVLTRDWKIQVLVSSIIFLGIWGQHRAIPEVAITLAILSVICWLLIRVAYITNSKLRRLSEAGVGREFDCLPLDDIGVADDFVRRYPFLQPGRATFNGIPFLLSTRYFDTSATPSRVVQLRLAKPANGLNAVHILVNAGNAWKR